MVKDKKIKKRKYTRREPSYKNFNPVAVDLGRETQEIKEEPANEVQRASEKSYFFMDGCKVLVRNLTDLRLNQEVTNFQNEMLALRRRLELLDGLTYNMTREQFFRGLR